MRHGLALFFFGMQKRLFDGEKTAREERARKLEADKQKLTAEAPIFTALFKYNQPMPRKRGNQADSWGSFILLAISEHIREKTGKPQYREAMTLIGHARQTSTPASRQKAEGRIRKFKEANPSWGQDLEWLKKQFALSPKSHKSPLA